MEKGRVWRVKVSELVLLALRVHLPKFQALCFEMFPPLAELVHVCFLEYLPLKSFPNGCEKAETLHTQIIPHEIKSF